MNKILLCCWLGVAALVAGCRGKTTYPVSGNVTFDGEPVSNGEIQLLPTDNSGPIAAGRIDKGQYHLQAKPGPKRVSIRAARQTQAAPGPMGPQFQDYIPAQFNTASTLTAQVKPSDDNRLDFDLQTGQKP